MSITLRDLIQKLQMIGVSMGDEIGKIDIDFYTGNREIIVEKDEDDETVEIYTKKTSHWVKDY